MTFRPRKAKYITERGGRFYYRRIIPESHHEMFGKKVVMIPLRGQSNTERNREAQVHAARHDKMLTAEIWNRPEDLPTPPDDTVEMRVESDDFAPYYRAGAYVIPDKISVTDDPARIRKAQAEGFFAMTQRELMLQTELNELRARFEASETEAERELANLKAERVVAEIDGEGRLAGQSVLSIMPEWRAHRNQAPTTWKKHMQYANEFADLHGDIALADVTKRHVVEYVQHCQKMTYKNAPISPGSVTKRLDSIKALLTFAADTDLIPFSPAKGVKPPRDTRPKTSKSWKSFEKSEISKLVTTATTLWTERRASQHAGRKDDLLTALHTLIWTGARPEEICQLRRVDIDLERLAILITNDESDDEARDRLVKNDRSTREIPIHSKLLPTLRAHIDSSDAALLFPTFEPKPTKKELANAEHSGVLEITGRYARPISREWTDHLREKIVPQEPRKVLYSLRHSWAAESRRAGMPENVRNAIMGHADDNQHAERYGIDADWLEQKRGYLEVMNCMH